MTTSPVRTRATGFTLLELVMAVAIMAIIVGMVFGTARTSLALSNTIIKTQNEEMLHQSFFDLLNRRFSSLPGNTRFHLEVKETGGRYISDLTLQNVPLSFTWGGQSRVAKAVQISTVQKRSGFLDVVLRYYENEVLEDAASNFGSVADNEPFAEIVLLTDINYFEWRLLDGRSMEWQYDWDLQGRLPLQLELIMAVGAKGEESRQIFWIPTKQNPEVHIRQILQSAGNQNGGANPVNPNDPNNPPIPGQPGQPGQPPVIQIPNQ